MTAYNNAVAVYHSFYNFQQVLKKNMIENIIPIIIELKHMVRLFVPCWYLQCLCLGKYTEVLLNCYCLLVVKPHCQKLFLVCASLLQFLHSNCQFLHY